MCELLGSGRVGQTGMSFPATATSSQASRSSHALDRFADLLLERGAQRAALCRF